MSTSEALPQGWAAVYDDTYGCHYFYHNESGKTQWEPPLGADINIYPPLSRTGPDGSEVMEHVLTEEPSSEHIENGSSESPKSDDSMDMNTSQEKDGAYGAGFKSKKIMLKSCAADAPVANNNSEVEEVANAYAESVTDLNNFDQLSQNDSTGEVAPHDRWIGGSSQDYLHLAEIYKIQREYDSTATVMNCVLCKKRACTDVFFPCQHRCLCPECIVTNQVVEHHHLALMPHGHCNCPLCGTIIKKIIPSADGQEVEIYWNWVCEVNPHLPEGFLRNFRHSAAVIQEVYVIDNNKDNKPSRSCMIS